MYFCLEIIYQLMVNNSFKGSIYLSKCLKNLYKYEWALVWGVYLLPELLMLSHDPPYLWDMGLPLKLVLES